MDKRLRNTLDKRKRRKTRKIIVLGVEGKNQTETLYFSELERRQNIYHFIFHKTNDTDPIKIISNTAKEAKKLGANTKYGDIAAVAFDMDLDNTKTKEYEKILKLAKDKNVEVYSSNPCFELWYLLHFRYSTKPYNSSKEVIDELKKYIPNYKKNRCDFNILGPLLYIAIKNAKQLQTKVAETNKNKESIINNPNTDIFKLVEIILENNNKDKKSSGSITG